MDSVKNPHDWTKASHSACLCLCINRPCHLWACTCNTSWDLPLCLFINRKDSPYSTRTVLQDHSASLMSFWHPSCPLPPCWPSPFRPSSRKKSHQLQSRSWSGSQGRFRVEAVVSRWRSSVVDCRQSPTAWRPGAPAAAQVHLYGVRARPEEKTSPERHWERNGGRSASPGCSCSSDRRSTRLSGTPSFRHNSATKGAATFRLGQRPVHMLALVLWNFLVAMILQTCF